MRKQRTSSANYSPGVSLLMLLCSGSLAVILRALDRKDVKIVLLFQTDGLIKSVNH